MGLRYVNIYVLYCLISQNVLKLLYKIRGGFVMTISIAAILIGILRPIRKIRDTKISRIIELICLILGLLFIISWVSYYVFTIGISLLVDIAIGVHDFLQKVS